jgi:hypothetical protein
MQCGVSGFFGGFAMIFLGFYAVILILGLWQLIQGQRYRSDVRRAKDRELGVKRGWLTEWSDDNNDCTNAIFGATSLIQRMLTKTVAIIIAVIAVVFAIWSQIEACF